MSGRSVCAHRKTVGASRWICVRSHHGGNHPYVDGYRRRAGQTPSVDKHYYVADPFPKAAR